MDSKILITLTFGTLLLASFFSLEARPFNATVPASQAPRVYTRYQNNYEAPAPCGNNYSAPIDYSAPLDPYTYNYDNARAAYVKRPFDNGTYVYDRAGARAGTMNRYNGYYNTSFLRGSYTSGVSSYPGTTTGPGISNGYHGTPKGVYFTDSRYYDRNIVINPFINNPR